MEHEGMTEGSHGPRTYPLSPFQGPTLRCYYSVDRRQALERLVDVRTSRAPPCHVRHTETDGVRAATEKDPTYPPVAQLESVARAR